ncbi:MAG: PHP domain-containing protein [Candidatus Cloacimonetes bacterium]|nr:PHP domain-containing protein [Candidatus Cloacimonadota bacterium]
MVRRFVADLHIHTCLSPCGDLEMYPERIVEMALDKKIDIIGICDHNSAENVTAVINAAKAKKLTVLPGIEVTSKEEVHILALFGSKEDALKLQTIIYENLDGENDEEIFGPQVVVNETGEVLGFNNKLLIGATGLSIKRVIDLIHMLNGIAIAAHIDRESFSIIGQLGFIPEDLELDGIEISSRITYQEALNRFAEYWDYPFIHSSDAHFLEDIGSVTTTLLLKETSAEEIRKALRDMDGRSIIY